MYIKSLVLEGFKSYGSKTVINGFDPEFNAITGLNGTGKSNILDSICFVLGISNLNRVRVTKLDELIYKSGHTGVTTASVTILFDNSDSQKSPLNYEQHKEITICRQISVGGKNRYLVNGTIATHKQISDFFNSVQLNINNPHFLIMQGRITRVLNMKPPEILSMIAEAAGTSMYEHKKNSAQKTMEKKDSKLKEMENLYEDKLNPKIQKLQVEKAHFEELQKIEKEFDGASRIANAYYYFQTQKTYQKEKQRFSELKNEKESVAHKFTEFESRIKSIDKELDQLKVKLNDDNSGGQESLSELKSKLSEKEVLQSKVKARVNTCKDTLNSQQKSLSQMEKAIKDDETLIQNKTSSINAAEAEFGHLREAEKADVDALASAEANYRAACEGRLHSEGGQSCTLQEKIIELNGELHEGETQKKQLILEVENLKRSLNEKEPLLTQAGGKESSHINEISGKKKILDGLKDRLLNTSYKPGYLDDLLSLQHKIKGDIKTCDEKIKNIEVRNPQIRFTYTDPTPNFDRSSVRGLLCSLFTVKDPIYSRALETIAGGKLYNVVVENEDVSSMLIQLGKLSRRFTFAPVNKIQGSKMRPQELKSAKSLVGNDRVHLALSLIDYKPEYENIMAWVFGQTFVTTDIDAAVAICENRSIRKKSVTLDGDVFDPNGLISGGAISKTEPILQVMVQLKKIEAEIINHKKELQKVDRKLKNANEWAVLEENIKDLESEIHAMEERSKQSSYNQLKVEIEELRNSLSKKTSILEEKTNTVKEKKRQINELEHRLKNASLLKDEAVKNAENEMKKARKKAEKSHESWQAKQELIRDLQSEIEDLKSSVTKYQSKLAEAKQALEKQNEEHETLTAELEVIQEETKRLHEEVNAKEAEISKNNLEIQKLLKEKQACEKKIGDNKLSEMSNEHEQKKSQEEVTKLKAVLKQMEKQHIWILEDRDNFGCSGGIYDFEANDPKSAAEKLKRLTELKQKLTQSVNPSAMNTLEQHEDDLRQVLDHKGIIQTDRNKIMNVISELNVRKDNVITTAWHQVSEDFNSILSTLLPGAHAKLVPENKKDGTFDGLQIKVGFGGIWKEGLDELSGGQRSLVALSLVLAMLLFSPAPLYILDEVDAALDQSHTQNVGIMLKKHFNQSQFIVVSLKDGMFSNANVLFRTSFVDGVSCITRTVNKT